MNRKLFKPRNARNQLNQMGGIMSSSAPLMQTVSKYNSGGPVGYAPGGVVYANGARQRDAYGNLPKTPSKSVAGGIGNFIKNNIGKMGIAGTVLNELYDTAANTSVDREGISSNPAARFSGPGQNQRPGITQEEFDAMKPEDQQAYFQTEQDRLAVGSNVYGIAQELAIVPDMIGNAYEGIAGSDIVQRALRASGIMSPSGKVSQTGPRSNEVAMAEAKARNNPFENIEKFRESLPSVDGPPSAGRKVEPTADYLQKLEEASGLPAGSISEEEDFNNLKREMEQQLLPGGASSPEAKFMMPGVTSSPEAASPEASPEASTEAKEGKLGVQAQVKAIIAKGTKEEQQNQLKTLMAEFTESAPEYEGMDKGLAIAKIGFAIAAGQSPNAMTNIATALSQGAGDFIKDKSQKDSFDRQVKLSALQYGIGETSKDRQMKRTNDNSFKDYFLMPGETYTYPGPDGRTVDGGSEGATISLTHSEILKNGLPSGVQRTDMAQALMDKKAAYLKNITAQKRKQLEGRMVKTPEAIQKHVDAYSKAVESALSASNAIHLTQQVMQINANGDMTGLIPSFKTAFNRTANALGIDLNEKFETRELAVSKMKLIFQALIPLTLGEDQSANSISNFDVKRLAEAFMVEGALEGGMFGLAFTDDDILNSKLQSVLGEFNRAQKKSLNALTSLDQTGAEFLLPGSGKLLSTSVSAQKGLLQSVFPEEGERSFNISPDRMYGLGKDGVYRLLTGEK